MRVRGVSCHGLARRSAPALAVALLGLGCAHSARAAASPAPSVPAYGQVAAVGGFDSAASYAFGLGTTGLGGPTGGADPDEFVSPVGMAVRPDPNAPGGEALYVLDLVDPQNLNSLLTIGSQAPNPDGLSLTYRIQEFAIRASTAAGDDSGSEDPLACTYFTLTSGDGAGTDPPPDQRAVSLAADNQSVDVLIDDQPDAQGQPDVPGDYSTADAIDEWTTSLEDPQNPSPLSPECASAAPTNTPAPDLAVSTATLQQGGSPIKLTGELDGESLAFAGGTAANDDDGTLALGATRYINSPYSGTYHTEPVIDLYSNGARVGKPWAGAEKAADTDASGGAKGWGIDESSTGNTDVLYALSADPPDSTDAGSLNVTLGPQEYLTSGFGDVSAGADLEPIMATVSADLSTTTPVLPDDSPEYDAGSNNEVDDAVNDEIADTSAAEQDTADGTLLSAPSGGTQDGGTLGPSVIQLDETNADAPKGIYAGFVADDEEGSDENVNPYGQPLSSAPAWSVFPSSGATANLGVRVFDPTVGNPSTGADADPSLAMVGNATPASPSTAAGACSVQSGDYGVQFSSGFNVPSMIALAPGGPDGTFYALTQPDLDAPGDGLISPGAAVSTAGDSVLEFSPGAGAGSPATPGVQCPQPSGSFAVDDGSDNDAVLAGNPITVVSGTKLTFDARTVNLAGGAPWSYNWSFDNVTTGQSSAIAPQSAWMVPSAANENWQQPTPLTTSIQFTTGTADTTYRVGLILDSDFGSYQTSQQVVVVPPGPITSSFTVSGGAVAGQPVSFDATGAAVTNPDVLVDYHWDFGNGTSDDTATPQETWVYPHPGTYNVTLSIIDTAGHTATSAQQVTVAPAPVPPAGPAPAPTTAPVPSPHIDRTPTTVSPKIRSIRRSTELSVKVSCPGTKVSCGGAIDVRTATAVKVAGTRGKHVVTLGKASFELRGGVSKTVVIKLAKETKSLIANVQLLKLRVLVAAHDSYGDAKTTKVTFDLFPPLTHRPKQFG